MAEDPVVSTRDQVGEYDAIETLKPGEPVFPLQGGDPFGPASIQCWVDQCRAAALREEDPERQREMLRKALQAEQVKWLFIAYQRGEEIERAGGAEIVNPILEDPRLWRAGLVAGTRNLREAAYHLENAASHLPPEMAGPLRREIGEINRIATAYEPKRASYGAQPDLPLEMPEGGTDA